MLLTWSLTKSTASSTNACVFDGTPDVALRVTSQRKPSPTNPRISDVTTVSTLTVQNVPSPTGFCRKVRWCWMYSEGES